MASLLGAAFWDSADRAAAFLAAAAVAADTVLTGVLFLMVVVGEVITGVVFVAGVVVGSVVTAVGTSVEEGEVATSSEKDSEVRDKQAAPITKCWMDVEAVFFIGCRGFPSLFWCVIVWLSFRNQARGPTSANRVTSYRIRRLKTTPERF